MEFIEVDVPDGAALRMSPSQAAVAAGFDAEGIRLACMNEINLMSATESQGYGLDMVWGEAADRGFSRPTATRAVFQGTYCVNKSDAYRVWQGCRDSWTISGESDPKYRYGAEVSWSSANDLSTTKSLYSVGVENR